VLIRSSQIKKEESPYKPDPILELFSAILGGHFESENEQKTQQSGAIGVKTSWQFEHV